MITIEKLSKITIRFLKINRCLQKLSNLLLISNLHIYDSLMPHVVKLPVKIRVFTEDRFQKAVAADAPTIFLCEQVPQASKTHHFEYSAAYPIFISFSTILWT